jgi:hypothetical protein
MILESQDEKNAFEFVCKLADLATDRICNDLNIEDRIKFNHLLVETDDEGNIIMRNITMDFDVIYWLKNQVKK